MLSDDARREFTREGDAYVLALPELGVSFRVDRVRRDRHELCAELAVDCDLPGARTVAGSLSVADFNMSSLVARQQRAKHLEARSNARDLDWLGLLEELCQRVITEERAGRPSVSLRDIPRPTADLAVDVIGVPLLLKHPAMMFGDGGSAKSLLALFFAGELAKHGVRVGFLDWELDGGDHRVRLEALYGPTGMPDIRYRRCDRPLVHMRDEVIKFVQADRLDYLVFDSVAFACDTKPEDAEAAQRYMQTVRATGVGSLHLAHISKAEGGDQKPFGSAFWHNGARSTWYVKPASSTPGGVLHLALLNRKSNLSGKLPPRGVKVRFSEERIDIGRADLRDVPELADTLPVSQRVRAALRKGTLTREALAEALDDVKADTLKKTLERGLASGVIVKFPGPDGTTRYGLGEPGGQHEK